MNKKVDLTLLVSKSNIKIGAISDTHSQLNEHIVAALHGCDVIVHAGDIGDANIIKELKKFTPYVFPVLGNNDVAIKWPKEDLTELDAIPESLELHFDDQVIGLIHGHQYDPVHKRHHKLRDHFPNANLIVYGHSHRFVCDQAETPWVINPGAGGYTRTFGGASCVVMNYENQQWDIQATRLEQSTA